MHQEGYGTVIHARLLVIGAPRRMSRCKLIRNTAGSVVGFFFFSPSSSRESSNYKARKGALLKPGQQWLFKGSPLPFLD